MNAEFPDIGCKYELKKIGDALVSVWLDNSLPKPQKLEQIADILIEYQDLMGLTDEELKIEIASLSKITAEDIIDAIMKYKDENVE